MKTSGISFRKKTSQRLDRIKNRPLNIIITLLAIYQEVLPSMVYVGWITPWKMFNMMCTGTAVDEFNDILFKSSGKTLEFIQVDLNEKICLADEKSNELKA